MIAIRQQHLMVEIPEGYEMLVLIDERGGFVQCPISAELLDNGPNIGVDIWHMILEARSKRKAS